MQEGAVCCRKEKKKSSRMWRRRATECGVGVVEHRGGKTGYKVRTLSHDEKLGDEMHVEALGGI